jgi:site-specific DNA-methyltransferase (adenine-specific)
MEKTHPTGHLNAKKMPMKAHENILVFYDKLPTYNPQITTGHKPSNNATNVANVQNNTHIYGKVKKNITRGGETTRYPLSIIEFPSDKQKNKLDGTIFPVQKPLALCEFLVKTYSNGGDLILDNTSGSGTTGLAASILNRNFIMMEKFDEGIDITEKRFEKYNKAITIIK